MKNPSLVRVLSVLACWASILLVVSAKTHFEVLGVKQSASDQEIKKNYKKLAKKWHPDKAKGDPQKAQEKFIEIAAAYEVLSDENKKADYMHSLRFGVGANVGSGPSNMHNRNNMNRYGRSRDPFEDIFRQSQSQQYQYQQRQRQQQGQGHTRSWQMFQSADGRWYKVYSSGHSHGGEQEENGSVLGEVVLKVFQLVIVPMLPYIILFIMGCMMLCNGCVGGRANNKNNNNNNNNNTRAAAGRHSESSEKKDSSSSSSGSGTHSNTPGSPVFGSYGLRLFSPALLRRKGVIVIIAFSPAAAKECSECQSQFRCDPIVFLDGTALSYDNNVPAADTINDDNKSTRGEMPQLLAVSKECTRWTELECSSSSSNNSSKHIGVESWLVRILDGTVRWNSNSAGTSGSPGENGSSSSSSDIHQLLYFMNTAAGKTASQPSPSSSSSSQPSS